ncbi:metal ABC transporter solute-binding protein, Zn/Mn family [Treponema pectinovorum]|uniref:metal ABC transporter solute-binding protein, Zn/Mn family n=1 Tax=Treponema pectinovorum TaxID=164 RepID=UPI0011CC3E56|nr:ZinT/AdcA family metal-binding protein [Treponema pectinovorum]
MKNIIKSILLGAMLLCSASIFAAPKKTIVCTSFPEYDWVMNILGSKASEFDVSFLQNKGTDLHSYQPSIQDIAKISKADMFIYVGGESDDWVKGALKNATNKNIKVINMMEVLGEKVRQEELIEGMQCTEHHHGEHHHHEHGHHHDEKSMMVFKGYFEDSQIKDRKLSDWEGEWQSVYPYLKDGSLDEVMQAKAENGDKTAQQYKQYYEEGYKTDVEKIVIKGNKISFYKNGKTATAKYSYKGYQVYNYPKGNRGVRFFFEAQNAKNTDAPKYIQFSDHNIAPTKVEHFHLYFGNEGFDALSKEMEHWPTYYPADFDSDDIVDDMLEHAGLSHKHEHNHEHEEDEVEYDEHVWLSLKNAMILTEKISEEIQKIDAKNAEVYKLNTKNYLNELSMLDKEYENVAKTSKLKTVLVGDRFPFTYLLHDYNISYHAAFLGCSAESEASFETIAFLSKKIDENGLNTVLTLEKSDKKIAKTIIKNSKSKDQKIMELDSLQSVSTKDVAKGKTYLSTMKQNLEVLKTALN